MATAVLPRRTKDLEGRRKPWWPVAAVIVGVVALLALATAAILAGGDPTAAVSSPARRASTAPSSPATSPSSSPSVSQPQTAQAAGAALLALTQQLQDAGAIDHKLASDIEHTVDEVVNGKGKHDEGADAADKLNELKDKVSEAVDQGTLSAADGGRLADAIDRLEQVLADGGD
jgi:hypothetical protein